MTLYQSQIEELEGHLSTMAVHEGVAPQSEQYIELVMILVMSITILHHNNLCPEVEEQKYLSIV